LAYLSSVRQAYTLAPLSMGQRGATSAGEPTFELCSSMTTFAADKSVGARHDRIAVGGKSWPLLCLCAVTCLFLLSRAYALDLNQPATSYTRTTFTVEDGLSSNVVNAILQTRNGFLWIGTDAGLNRFDGRHFTPIYFRGPQATPQGVVTSLAEGPDGDLWIGTSAGLVRIPRLALDQFDRSLSVFYHPGAGISDEITWLRFSRDGVLWVGTGAGLYRFVENRLETVIPNAPISRIEESIDGHLLVVSDQGFIELDGTRVVQQSGIVGSTRHSIQIGSFNVFQDRKGATWFCTTADLARGVNGSIEEFQPYGIGRGPGFHGVFEDAQGNLWVMPSTGMLKLDPIFQHPQGADWLCATAGLAWFRKLARGVNGSIDKFQPYGIGRGRGFHRVFEDAQGNLWVMPSTGIFRVSGAKLEPMVHTVPDVRAARADRDGNLWIGTNGEGLMRFKDHPIRMFTKADGLPNNIPMTVLSKRDGTLWVGNNCNGLSVFNGQRFKTYDERDGLSNSCVWALAEGQSGELWVGTWGGGLFRFANGQFVQFTKRQGLAGDVVRAIIVAHDGSLWLATDGGLSHMVNGEFHNYTTADGLSSNRVVSVHQDRHGTIWVGTSRGINRMTGDRFASVLSQHEIFDPRYISFAEDSSSELYAISAPKGLDRIEGNRLVEVTHDLDLLSMASSPGGQLWFTGGNGIFRFSAAALGQNQGGEEPPLDYAWFGTADGMLSTQCSIGAPNMALAPDGKLWVATVKGLAMLDLQHLSSDTGKPPIFVEEVTVGRTRRPAGRELVLPPGTHHVELHFDSIELSSPEKIRFQYRMDDVDPVWLEADNSLTAIYTNIPIGTHAFKIRASNSDGVWDRSGISFAVTQKPYFYQTWWFRLSCVAAFVAVLWALYQLRLGQVTAQVRQRMEGRFEERERIARELHDTLLQGFQGITLRMYGVTKNMPTHDPLRKMVDEVLDRADQVIREARQGVRNLRRRTSHENELSDRLAKHGEELAKDHAASFTLGIVGSPKVLESTVQDEALRIVNEALTNAFQHASASTIEAEVTYDSSALRVRVRDDGVGIDKGVLTNGQPGHWGLTGMRERAQAIRAELNIWSRELAGTEVELVIPASIAYPKEQRKTN
jgi:ligand-binding sensor domain-containing protein/signal transduction histidine kinase